jgi:single-stranded DNA-binding protein
MLTLTGNGRLTRDVQLRATHSGTTVATISVASDRRDRNADPVYVELIVWEAQATAAGEHLIKGQAVSFSGRLEPRPYVTSSGEQRVASSSTTSPSSTGQSRAAPTTTPGPRPSRPAARPKRTSRSERSTIARAVHPGGPRHIRPASPGRREPSLPSQATSAAGLKASAARFAAEAQLLAAQFASTQHCGRPGSRCSYSSLRPRRCRRPAAAPCVEEELRHRCS